MKAIAVIPGKQNSVHLAQMSNPTVDEVPNGRGVLVKVLRVGVDGTDNPFKGLENYRVLFDKLLNPNGAIKVFCEVAEL